MAAQALIESVLQNWPAVLGIAITAYLISNRFNRGLNRYPGPFLASLTDWWRFWVVYKRRPEVEHIRLHEKHGDVVRLGPNALSFSDPKALKTIYGLNKGFTKTEFYPVQQAVASGHRLPSLFSTTSEAFHAQLRRSVNSAFSMTTLIQYEPFVDSTTELFLSQTEKLYAKTGTACNFSRWLQFYAFDVIGEMTYSKRHGFLEENRDIDGIIDYVANLFDYAAPIGQIPFLDLLFLKNPIWLLLGKYGLVDGTFPVAKFARARMLERYPTSSDPKSATILPSTEPTAESKKPDLLSKFVQAKYDRAEFMNDSLVMTMAISMAFAGSETTAISLSSVFYYLLKNPRCMEEVYRELDSKAKEGFFGDYENGLVTWTESQKLPYLDACIKEAFRLHPAPGLTLERIVPPQGADIAGHFVKGGTIVGCSAWVMHRRKEIFGEDVEVYRPERWLVDELKDKNAEEKRIKEMTGTMLQFGAGARTCIGKNISLLEMYKVVPSLLRRFEIRLEDPTKEWTIHNAWFVRQLNFNTTFHRRELVKPSA
ncbi:cytochrome P450 [Hyaloscypha bicolor E]|uniref:Cytochrome P450 n=1 Tax=Hyaloscypha bicolor E TaxID=1095630 RepID=A0A2J6TRL9_9HELO|nr:cytochrome P450 [Hyaloscypha bicolor E]PMD65671.1 cytochrome P450 [Hyaloscypha bicolor E]